jgi:hypothetical protein
VRYLFGNILKQSGAKARPLYNLKYTFASQIIRIIAIIRILINRGL